MAIFLLNPRIFNRQRIKLYLALTAFYWWSILSVFWTHDLKTYFQELSHSITFILFLFVASFTRFTISLRERNILLKLFLVGALIFLCMWYQYLIDGINLYQTIGLKEEGIKKMPLLLQLKGIVLLKLSASKFYEEPYYYALAGHEISPYYGNRTFFSHHTYLSLLGIISLYISIMLFVISKGLEKLLYIFLVISNVFFIWVLDSKIGLFFLYLSPVFFTLEFLKYHSINLKKKFIILSIAFFAIVLSMTLLLHPNVKLKFLQKTFSYEDSGYLIDKTRLDLYMTSAHIIKKNWLVGVGLGDINSEMSKEMALLNYKELYNDQNIQLNTHNQFLYYFVGTGILGIIFLGLFFVVFLKKVWPSKDYLALSFIALVFVSCLFENILNRSWGVFFVVSFGSLFILQYSNNRTNEES